MSVPKSMQPVYDRIAPLIEDFCKEKLDDDYQVLCLRLLEKLCRKRPSPLLSGRANTWAAGIVYAIATNNFIFDKSQPIHLTADELTAPFGLAKSTVANKANEISKQMKIARFNPEWMLPRLIESSSVIWLVSVNGLVVDIRDMPLELQEEAYRRGLIPYVPALREAEKKEASAPAEPTQDPEPAPQEETSAPEKAESEQKQPEELPPEDFSDIYKSFGSE